MELEQNYLEPEDYFTKEKDEVPEGDDFFRCIRCQCIMGDQQLYTLTEMTDILDETFGKSVEVRDFFPDTDKYRSNIAENS